MPPSAPNLSDFIDTTDIIDNTTETSHSRILSPASQYGSQSSPQNGDLPKEPVNTDDKNDEVEVSHAENGEKRKNEALVHQTNNPFTVPPSIAKTLPNEILVIVFSYLSPGCLDAASLVCKRWYEASSEASWKASFLRHFASSKFNRVTSSLKWRTELMTRLDYLHKWRKGHCNNLSFNALIWDISHVFTDFEASRITAFSIWRGVGTIADPTKGKIANQRIFTSKLLQVVSDTSCVDGSRFGLIYGFLGGGVQATLFSHETRLRDYVSLKGHHFGDVTAVWINRLENPRTTTKIAALSGGEDGHIFQWEFKTYSKVRDLPVCPGRGRIIHIRCDSRDKIVCMNDQGEIFFAQISLSSGGGRVWGESTVENDIGFVKIGTFVHPVVDLTGPANLSMDVTNASYFDADFATDYVIFAHGQYFMRFKLTLDESKFESVHFSLKGISAHATIVAASMDHTMFPQSDLLTDTPGYNTRYVAAATSDNFVFVWLLQGEAENSVIQPLRVSESPFQVSSKDSIDSSGNLRPSISAIALNSMVLLLGSYNGITVALDLLTGEFLRVVSSRFSKRALNLRATDDPDSVSLWPITHLEIDPDPSNPHGIITVRSAIQYFNLGADHEKSAIKKKGVKKKNRIAYNSGDNSNGSISRSQIAEEIEMDIELMNFEDEELTEARANRFSQGYSISDDISEEDQLKYAMLLSEEAARNESSSHLNKTEDEVDEEIRRAIELSVAETEGIVDSPSVQSSSSSSSSSKKFQDFDQYYSDHDGNGDGDVFVSNEDDDELRLALELSKAESGRNSEAGSSRAINSWKNSPSASQPVTTASFLDGDTSGNNDFDDDLELAIRLSLAEAEGTKKIF